MTAEHKAPTMEASEIAALLGWKVPWFRRQVKRLIQQDGMPAPLPGGRWWREGVERWLDTYGQLKAKETGKSLSEIRIQWDQNKLTAKYAGVAA